MKQLPYESQDTRPMDEDDEFILLNEEIKKNLRRTQFKAGERLYQMQQRKRGHYGPYPTFQDYIKAELRISKMEAYHLIFAHLMDELLRANGCAAPINERQVRPLRVLKEDAKRVLAWDRACAMTQGRRPTSADVRREVARLFAPAAGPADEGFHDYRQHMLNISRELRKATELREDGRLQAFLIPGDSHALRRKKSMAKLMVKIIISLSDHYKDFGMLLSVVPQDHERAEDL
jgi:hypothetical protein